MNGGRFRVSFRHGVRHAAGLAVRMAVLHLCWFPVALAIGHFALQGRTAQLLALMLGLSFAGILAGLAPKKAYAEVLIALFVSGAAVLAVFGTTPRALAAFPASYAVTHLGMRSAQFAPEEGLPTRVIALGLGTYLLMPILHRVDPSLGERAGLHSAVCLAAAAAAIFLLNRTQLYEANLKDRTGPDGVSPDIRVKNALYAAGFLAAVAAVASIGAINRLLSALREAVKAWLGRLGGEPGEYRPDAGGPGGLPALPIEAPSKEPSPFWTMLQEILVHAVGWLAVLAALAAAGYLAVAKLYPFLGRLAAGLNRDRRAALDYLDETEKLEAPDIRSALRRAAGRMKRRPAPELPDDPRERVRARYRMMLDLAARDGLAPDPARTPSETAAKLEEAGWRKVPAALVVRLYNPVRYGGKDVDPAALAELERAWHERRDRGR